MKANGRNFYVVLEAENGLHTVNIGVTPIRPELGRYATLTA